jgi:hypothetical protein
VADKVFACRKQVAEDGLGDEVHVPCGYGEGDEYALLNKVGLAWGGTFGQSVGVLKGALPL